MNKLKLINIFVEMHRMNLPLYKTYSSISMLKPCKKLSYLFIKDTLHTQSALCDQKKSTLKTLENNDVKEFFHPKIEELSNRLDIKLPKWSQTLHLSYVWLRDHCRCSQCYNKDTFQRKFDVQSIPLNLRPLTTKALEHYIEIQWPDNHKSKYDYKFLWQNTYEGCQTTLKSHSSSSWTKSTFPALEKITVPSELFKTSKESQKKLVASILKYGIGMVSGVDASSEATREVVEVICAVKRTFFGEMWSFQADLEHADTAYSNEFLGAHTDTTYLTEASRIQVFHALKASDIGGETLLVDGFAVANQFKKCCPDGYKFLSTTAFPADYEGDNQHHRCTDFIFKHHPISGNLTQFRYNIYDRGPLSTIPFEKINLYYSYLQQLTEVVRKPRNEFWIKLQPGVVTFIDNWRLMHGRNQYSGSRVMGGCYLDNSEFLSKARVLGIHED